jgi:hypothetical protein
VLSAIESPANQRPPFVNCTAALAEINARSIRTGFENKNGFSRGACCLPRAVRFDIVSLLGVEKQSLAGSAAFDAAVTRYLGCLFGSQLSF